MIVSAAGINRGPSNLAVVVPLTTRDRSVALHVPIDSPEGGPGTRSVALPEQIHVVVQERLTVRWGKMSTATMHKLEDPLRIVLDLA